ncbi:hypothetical protein B0H14DRAFT_3589076 [Mycena olivaceomarginata]|nr:hypothetical protein B0H14DRAFT_3589076 [Mycena olivaceomarginata]
MSAICYSSGTQTFRLTPTRNKQADQSFCSVVRPINSPPVVVVEVGVSESRTRLIDDACWWLESGHVNLVILIIIRKSEPQSLRVELWERQPNLRPSRTAAARLWLGSPRGQPVMYPRPVQGAKAVVPPLVIPYADLEINLPNSLIVPLDNWTAFVWRQMG